MSEYTKYFAVKSSSEESVRDKLNKSKIISLVSADKADYWFDENYKRNGIYTWVIVSAPADTNFQNGNFYYKNKFDDLAEIFDVFVLFFQEENLINWSLEIRSKEDKIFLEIYEDKKLEISNQDIKILEQVFDKQWNELKSLMKPDKAHIFLNFVGIPYCEMNDQDKVPKSIIKGDTYSILASDIM